MIDPNNTNGRGHKHVREQWINYLTGKMIFDTKDGGFQYLNHVQYFLSSGHVIMEGFNGDTAYLCCVNMANRKKMWQIKKPGFIKRTLLGNTNPELYIDIDVTGNYIMCTNDSLFAINGTDGTSLWRINRSEIWYNCAVSKTRPYLFGCKTDTVVRMNTATGVIDKIITMKDNVLPYVAQHNRDINASQALQVIRQPLKISVFDTLVLLEGKTSFVTIGQSMEAINNHEGYIIGSNHRFKKFVPLKDSTLIGVFINEDRNYAVNIKYMRFNNQYKSNWQYANNLMGMGVRGIYLHDETLVVVSDRDIRLVDINSGAEKKTIGKSIPRLDSTFLFADNPNGSNCSFFQSGRLYQLDYKTLEVTEILNKTGFKGGDPEDKTPLVLEGREDGWYLGAGQNMLLVDYNNKMLYNQYYDRPGMSMKGLRLLAGIGGLVAGYMFRDAASTVTDVYYNLGEINGDEYANLKTWDFMASGTGSAAVTSDLARSLVNNNNNRNMSKLLSHNSDYQLIFGKQDGKPCLFQIDKKTGSTKSVIFMNNKKQKMETDLLNRGVFTIDEGGKTFEYYALK